MVHTEAFGHLPQVKVINLTGNFIKKIQQGAFGLQNRTIPDYSHYSLRTVPLGASDSIPLLTTLDLSHNSLETIPGEDILALSQSSLKYLYLEGNPWNCSCEMIWVLVLNTSILASSPAVCHNPPELRGTALQDLTPRDFEHCFIEDISIGPYFCLLLVASTVVCVCMPTLSKLYHHPFFWNTREMEDFYHQIGNLLENPEYSKCLVHQLEQNSSDVIRGDWMACLDKAVKGDLRGFKHRKTQVCGLLRVIRNKTEHFAKLRPEVRCIYSRAGGVVPYYSKHFPKLLPHTYSAWLQVRDQLRR